MSKETNFILIRTPVITKDMGKEMYIHFKRKQKESIDS